MNTTKSVMINTNPETSYETALSVAAHISTLTGASFPELHTPELEKTIQALDDVESIEAGATESLLAGDSAEARAKLIALSAADRTNPEVRTRVENKARKQTKAEDTPQLIQYIVKNVEKARTNFNKAAEEFTAHWQVLKTQKITADMLDTNHQAVEVLNKAKELMPRLEAGEKVINLLSNSEFGMNIPRHTHTLTTGNFYPSTFKEDKENTEVLAARPNFGDKNFQHYSSYYMPSSLEKLGNQMNGQPKPGDQIKLYWKSAAEFEQEQATFTQLLEEVPDLKYKDIQIYEFWLSQK